MSGEVAQGRSNVPGLVPVVRQFAEDDGAGDRYDDGEGVGGSSQANNGDKGYNHRHARFSEIKPNKC